MSNEEPKKEAEGGENNAPPPPKYMTHGEELLGTMLFVLIGVILLLLTDPTLPFAVSSLGTFLKGYAQSPLMVYLMFGLCILVFRDFLIKTSINFLHKPGTAIWYSFLAFIAMYGLNELLFRVGGQLTTGVSNMNDLLLMLRPVQENQLMESLDHLHDLIFLPRPSRESQLMTITVVFAAPFVEEVLYRGLVFGILRGKNRIMAFLVSSILFALPQFWQFVVVDHSMINFIMLLQYMAPGLAMAWAYDKTGTLWSAVGLHAVANALAIWTAA